MRKLQCPVSPAVLLLVVATGISGCRSTLPPTTDAPASLKKMALADLMNLEVTSVSRTATSLSETAAAVEVITSEDIRRSGATTLAEALRLASNLQIARVNSHDWAITARGFNSVSVVSGSIADKLLVMIDGRSIYTPLFAGVFWDAQQLPLDDIDRIEVVSGPGGTLWGANAVNGVINIITKSAKETHGGSVEFRAGPFAGKAGEVRVGGAIGNDTHYRAYGQWIEGDSTRRLGVDGGDDWESRQGGFRIDHEPSADDTLTVQGDFYEGEQGTPHSAFINGQNAMLRWTHASSPQSEWSTQVYFDRSARTFPRIGFRDELQTADFDLQHSYRPGGRHALVWGIGYRHMQDDVRNGGSFSFLPAKKTMRLGSAFVQDEITPRDDVRVTLGAKLEHNDFSGLEVQPSVRVAWTPPQARQMAWAAVSRAVRSPSRFDTELSTRTSIANPNFGSESVMAYELGYRVRPHESLSLAFSAFHNRYDDLRSVNQSPPQPPTYFANDLRATSNGIELSGLYSPTDWWRLRGGWTWMEKDFRTTDVHALSFSDAFEAQDSDAQLLLQSNFDLSRNVELDVVARYVSAIPATLLNPRIAPYTTTDIRLAWRNDQWEIAAIGQNLGGSHPEFSSPIAFYEIPTSIQGRLKFSW